MIDLSELLDEAEGKPVKYKGQELIRADRVKIDKHFKAEIELISVDSQWRQGISVRTKGKIDAGDGLIGPKHIFWQELWTELNEEMCIRDRSGLFETGAGRVFGDSSGVSSCRGTDAEGDARLAENSPQRGRRNRRISSRGSCQPQPALQLSLIHISYSVLQR